MGMSLQLRENLEELLFSEKYDCEDTEMLIIRRFEKPRPVTDVVPVIENPLFRKITELMGVRFDHAALRDFYYSAEMGDGCIFVFPYKDTQYFLALDLHRDRLEETDAVTLAVYCDARKYVKLKELFELLQRNSGLDTKLPLTETPLIQAVLESDKKTVYYKGDRIPVATREQEAKVCPDAYMRLLLNI
ncbi:MAG: hypothetical protein IKO27_02660 [Ruminococcus sp.]|nr:hypothetical protein [Ruminococcus sp.]